jgi:hypothetical protein
MPQRDVQSKDSTGVLESAGNRRTEGAQPLCLSSVTKKAPAIMFVSRNNEIQNGRAHYSIGGIKAFAKWRPAGAAAVEADRLAAVQALILEAEEYEADAIVSLDFETDDVKRDDIDGTPLQRIAAIGIAVRFRQDA